MPREGLKALEERTRYDPREVEPRVLRKWLEAGYFHSEPEGSADENYSIAIPPPNVTGVLHMGHALNASVQDTLIRFNRMSGRRTKWIFGTDHAGIATQAQVEKLLASEGTSREELGRVDFDRRVWEWREEYGRTIVEQFQRLGASCDYDDERFTLDERYVEAVIKVFVDLYDKGLIYRDNYMVNWDPGTRSAISDLEVEDREVTDTLYYIDYPLQDGSGVVTVATVRPETMLADTGVAVHPDDERYQALIGRHVVLPLLDRPGRRVRSPARAARGPPPMPLLPLTSSSAAAFALSVLPFSNWIVCPRRRRRTAARRAPSPTSNATDASAATAGVGSPKRQRRRSRLGAGRSASGPAERSSAASRSTSAMIRSFSAAGGRIGGAATASASAAMRSSSTSARHSGQVFRCVSNAERSSSGSAPSR